MVTGTTTTGSDGSYTIAVAGAQRPCLLELSTSDGSLLHAVSNDLTGIANITPLTEALAGAVLNQRDLAALYASLDVALLEGIKTKVTPASVDAAWNTIKADLVGQGVDVSDITNEPTTATLSASATGQGNAYDKLLDDIGALNLSASNLYQMAGGSSFVKLDSTGTPLPIQAGDWSDSGSAARGTSWDCVQDTASGLYWEVKRNDLNHLRHRGHLYSWYDTSRWENEALSTPTLKAYVSTTGGSAGSESTGILNSCKGVANNSKCNTSTYVDAVNSVGICGFKDWVLPDAYTLQTLVKDRPRGPMIDSNFFPNTLLGTSTDIAYWSSSASANNSAYAWHVSFSTGRVEDGLKSSARPILLVRGGAAAPAVTRNSLLTCDSSLSGGANAPLTTIPTSRPDSRYTIAGATVQDSITGLTWQRCVMGSSGAQCDQGSPARRTYADALLAAQAAGSGWRLPTRIELSSLVERKCSSRLVRGVDGSLDTTVDGALNLTVFPQPTVTSVWSSTTGGSGASQAWYVNFFNGFVDYTDASQLLNVRLVRSP